jgi:hypothetical protein
MRSILIIATLLLSACGDKDEVGKECDRSIMTTRVYRDAQDITRVGLDCPDTTSNK